MSTTLEHILAIPLEEMRERAELAERIALALRLTPEGAYATATAGVNPASTGGAAAPAAAGGKRKTKAEKEAEDRAAAAASAASSPANQATTTTSAPASDAFADMDLTSGNTADGSADLGEFGDDMLAGFTADEPAVTLEQASANITALVADIQAKRDQERLTKVRAVMQEFGVDRVGALPEDKRIAFWVKVQNV